MLTAEQELMYGKALSLGIPLLILLSSCLIRILRITSRPENASVTNRERIR